VTAPHLPSETPLPSFAQKRYRKLPDVEELSKTGRRDIPVYSGIRRAQKTHPYTEYAWVAAAVAEHGCDIVVVHECCRHHQHRKGELIDCHTCTRCVPGDTMY